MTNLKSEIDGLPTNIRIPMRMLGFVNILLVCAIGIGLISLATGPGMSNYSVANYGLALAALIIGTYIFFIIAPRLITAGKYVPGFVLLALPLIGAVAGGLVYLQSGLQVLQNMS